MLGNFETKWFQPIEIMAIFELARIAKNGLAYSFRGTLTFGPRHAAFRNMQKLCGSDTEQRVEPGLNAAYSP